MANAPTIKTIGLIGGLSWASTQDYYRLLNQGVQTRLGGSHSANLLMYSVNFAQIEALQHQGQWEAAGALLNARAHSLERAGAQCLLLATNTMHCIWPQLTQGLSIPALHIAQPTGKALSESGIKTVGLLGTRFTMEMDFYKGYLQEHFQLKVIIPEAPARQKVHDIIYQELCHNQVLPASTAFYIQTIESLAQQGCEAVILGCTEIGLMINAQNSPLPVFNTTDLHVQAALDWSLSP